MQNWETGMQQALLTGDLDEVTFVDTILHNYKYKYDELVKGLKAAPGDPTRIEMPKNIDNPDLLRQKLIGMGELAFQSYVDSIEKKKERAKAPGVPFDIKSLQFGPLKEVEVGDIPESYKATGYRSYDSYETSLKQIIRGSQENKDMLIKIKSAISELGKKIGGLKTGQRSTEYLKGTPEGQAIVNDLTNFVNEKLSSFVTHYKGEIVSGNEIDTKKLGRKGSIGNALLVVDFARLYTVISKILDSLHLVGEVKPERQNMESIVEETREQSKKGIDSTIEANTFKDKIQRMSELLWIPFEERTNLK